MKKELSSGTVMAIIGGVVAVVGLFFLFQWMSGASPSAQDKKLEEMSVQQAKGEYGRYQNPEGQSAPNGGPPASGEGAAQAANPGGVPATGN
ncbi:MAG: hypothetical protein K1X67_21830 [Fimbriimonadaceae bacterium]|nr:hypothetical protein [Fimbriimonadaceae bacterium]